MRATTAVQCCTRRSLAVIAAVVILGTLAACSGIERNETDAIMTLRTILSAQLAHSANCGGFAKSLPALGAAGELGRDLAASDEITRRGYRLTHTASNPLPASTCGEAFQNFQVVAIPEVPGETGGRYFRASEDGVFAATKADYSDAKMIN